MDYKLIDKAEVAGAFTGVTCTNMLTSHISEEIAVCVCVWGVKNQNLEISVRKEKVKRVRGVCRRQ